MPRRKTLLSGRGSADQTLEATEKLGEEMLVHYCRLHRCCNDTTIRTKKGNREDYLVLMLQLVLMLSSG